jgi:DNA-directed RNA polymerase subunit F
MRKIVLSVSIVLLAIAAQAQPPAGEAKTGEWYGEKTTADGAIAMAEIPAKLEKTETIETKIKAKIVDVCPKKGCWLKLQVNDSTTAMVKMKDYGFFLPLAAKGKTVVIDGEVKMKTTSVAELQHYAEDAKKTKEEIAAITKPEKEIRVTAKGIVIVD